MLRLAMANPLDQVASAGVAFATGRPVLPLAALESESRTSSILHTQAPPFAGLASDRAEDLDQLSDHASEAPVIRLVQRVLTSAMDGGASRCARRRP